MWRVMSWVDVFVVVIFNHTQDTSSCIGVREYIFDLSSGPCFSYLWHLPIHTHTKARYALTELPDSGDPLPLSVIKTNRLLDFYKENDLLPLLEAMEDQRQTWGFQGSTEPLRFLYVNSRSFGVDIVVISIQRVTFMVTELWNVLNNQSP